ncbi:Orn/Lys/Arg decarboxylase N-terminal domain-containing protein [Escherichia coli]
MSELKIAVSRTCPDCLTTQRNITNTCDSNFIDVAAAVLSIQDIECGKLDEIDATGYNLPVFIAIKNQYIYPQIISHVFKGCLNTTKRVTTSMAVSQKPQRNKYEVQLRPPFFSALVDHVAQGARV